MPSDTLKFAGQLGVKAFEFEMPKSAAQFSYLLFMTGMTEAMKKTLIEAPLSDAERGLLARNHDLVFAKPGTVQNEHLDNPSVFGNPDLGNLTPSTADRSPILTERQTMAYAALGDKDKTKKAAGNCLIRLREKLIEDPSNPVVQQLIPVMEKAQANPQDLINKIGDARLKLEVNKQILSRGLGEDKSDPLPGLK